ncbi:general substrate transporter [Aspergillus tamarii]|uniref:General substrate transporter n=1 Tax=Aspergillus tamarii TaxID=41984 RepID=A0A5N6V513_ASPTM|nr:general substrate transporter [Aspergillus tamarii]
MAINSEKLAEAIDQATTIDGDLPRLDNEEQHQLSKLECLKKYYLSSLWSLFAVWCSMLASFEMQTTSMVLSIPKFRMDFGYEFHGNYVLPADWQSAFLGAPVASMVIGSLGGGILADWLGRRPILVICLAITYASITMEFIAVSIPLFFGGKFLAGFAVGAMGSTSMTYIGEIAPLSLRGFFTCLVALGLTFSPFMSSLIINDTGTVFSRWAYRAVFCSQYGFAAIPTFFVFFMPESPWWLVSKGCPEKALGSLARLGVKGEDGRRRLAAISQTIMNTGTDASYLECFRGSNLRRTIVSMTPMCIQPMCGLVFITGYTTYYLQLAGFSTSMSFKLQIVQQVVMIIGNIMSWFLIDRVGRRNLNIYGTLAIAILLWLAGGLAVANTQGSVKGTVALVFLYAWCMALTIQPVSYTIMTEVPTPRLRMKTIAIASATYSALNMMWGFVLPYMFNPDKANLGAKITFIFGGVSTLIMALVWFLLPETANRTYQELDEMFEKRVPARKFRSFMKDI